MVQCDSTDTLYVGCNGEGVGVLVEVDHTDVPLTRSKTSQHAHVFGAIHRNQASWVRGSRDLRLKD